MPFGKHRGKPFPSLPQGYLLWLCYNIEPHGEYREVRLAAWDEWERRRWKNGKHIFPGSYETGKRR